MRCAQGAELGARRRALLFALAAAVLGLGACAPAHEPRTDLPAFDAPAIKVGALLCISGSLSEKTWTAERAALLAEEYVNGSDRLLPDGADPAQIPCRLSGRCGAWAGADASGNALRGPLEVLVADSEERVESAVAAALELKDRHDVRAIIGPCTEPVMRAVFERVTRTDLLLVSPFVTADSISLLDDRTTEDKSLGLSGYVYRTVPPDYIQAEALAQIATNRDVPRLLLRSEDETEDDCTWQTPDYCDAKYRGQGRFECTRTRLSSDPAAAFIELTTQACTADSAAQCKLFGDTYECMDAPGGGQVCGRPVEHKYCAHVVEPQTAMILHADDNAGRALRDEIQDAWVVKRGKYLLDVRPFDPSEPAAFGAVVAGMFRDAARRHEALQAQGLLESDHRMGDSVVFLFAEPTEAALLLQQWLLQADSLGAGARSVFWLGTDALRSPLLLDGTDWDGLRNLHLTDPSVLDEGNRKFFEDLFRGRWGVPPSDYSAHVFDTVLLLALANERAGWLRGAGERTQNPPKALKDSLRPVSAGCAKQTLVESCEGVVQTFAAGHFSSALEAASRGESVRLQGVTGDLSLSPEGDRLNDLRVWRVARTGGETRFSPAGTFEPQAHGITLRR